MSLLRRLRERLFGVAGKIYSVGYEGMSAKGLAESLSHSGVKVVVDVRLNAISRRPGFSKKSLRAALEAAGLEYVHEPELGNPQDNRAAFRRGDAEGPQTMRRLLSNGSRPALERVIKLAGTERIAVLCVERDPAQCHRHVIVEMIREEMPGLTVVNVT